MVEPWVRQIPSGWEIRVKVVPGSSRSRIAGVLGDRLKIQVAAPPEDGKANKAVAEVLAQWLGLAKSEVELVSGASQPAKVFRIPPRQTWPSLT
ncbi:MAG: DUF167 domain-containing protein [Fibrobacteres bacterium]|nr:DUF167 domain-containing protein [Fibrobacterota bacterium]